ncbi:hypothetical protein D7V97_21740 [Corallococcus sp. CA053C]|nr:hypothetical protein D7V97_21740 [Corallococcus sp. CA053C]
MIQTLVGHADLLPEALERVSRRAVAEGWTEDTAIWKDTRELVARRARLTGLALRRLDALAVAPPELSLEETLTRLDALVREPVRRKLAPGEVVVFETNTRRHSDRSSTKKSDIEVPLRYLLGVALGILLTLPLLFVAPPALERVAAFLVLGVGMACWWVPLLRSGRLLLTSERLLWLPHLGEPQSVRLASIPDDGVQLDRSRLDVRVEGDRRLHARLVPEAWRVMLLLELHRQPPLLGAARAGVQVENAVVFAAKLGKREGCAVLRPGGVSFIPDGQERQALLALTGKAPSLPRFDLERVLDTLRWLPASEFDACVARVVAATGGLFRSAEEARHVPGPPAWMWLRIQMGSQMLLGRVALAQAAAAKAVLKTWPQAAE